MEKDMKRVEAILGSSPDHDALCILRKEYETSGKRFRLLANAADACIVGVLLILWFSHFGAVLLLLVGPLIIATKELYARYRVIQSILSWMDNKYGLLFTSEVADMDSSAPSTAR